MQWDGVKWDSFNVQDLGRGCSQGTPATIRTIARSACASPLVASWTEPAATLTDNGYITLDEYQVSPAFAVTPLAPAVDVFASCDDPSVPVWALRADGHLASKSAFDYGAWVDQPDDPDNTGKPVIGLGLWGASSTDVWEVLQEEDATGPATAFRHYDGTSWRTVQRVVTQGPVDWPSTFGGQHTWGRSSTDIYAVIPNASSTLYGDYGYVWHYDGQAWSPTAPVQSGTPLIAGTSTSLFAAGLSGQIFQLGANQWTKLAGGDPDKPVEVLSVPRHDDVWVLEGRPNDPVDVRHFDGKAWNTLPDPSSVPGLGFVDTQDGVSMVGLGPSDAWVIAGTGNAAAGYAPSALHWDGAAWTSFPIPGTAGLPWGMSLWASGPADIWGCAPSSPVLHWDGAAWATKALGAGYSCVGVSGTSASDVWFLAEDAVTPDPALLLLHWDGLSFAPGPAIPSANASSGMTGILAADRDDLWLFGVQTAMHWNGSAWAAPPGLPAGNKSAWASGSSDVWFAVAADRATLVHWDGVNFSQDTVPPLGPSLFAIAGAGPDDFWVGGFGGAVLRSSLDAPPASQ
jgi:hypothetical protein